MSFYYLKALTGPETGQLTPLTETGVSIGRSKQNTVSFPASEKAVSSHHAILYISATQLLLQDLMSTNGTFINNDKIEEQELAPDDIISLGKTGPRFQFIVSEAEINTSLNTAPDTPAPTIEAPPETDEDEGTYTRSPTVALENKFLKQAINQDDLHSIIKDDGRVDRLIKRGNIKTIHADMLRTMQGTRQKVLRFWGLILLVVISIGGIAISYFAIRAAQYRARLNSAQKLEGVLDDYESKIAAARSGKDSAALEKLIAEFEKKSSEFSQLKEGLDQEDFVSFYEDPLERAIDGVLLRFGESNYHIPPKMVERIRHHISIFTGRMKPTTITYLRRRDRYFPMIHRIFREKNLPVELAYVAMLESGLSPTALSHAGARGLWQFMPRTARGFGLKVNDSIDERLNPEKATRAAAEYFKDLIGIFGGESSVMLVMAAYNAGEGRVMGALRRIDDPLKNRDFWYIYRMGYLAEETNEYIPKIIAFMIISETPEEYGITP